MTTTAHALEEELRFYYAHKPDLLRSHSGSYLLVKGGRLLGAFPTEEAAVSEGLRQFGPVSFLVKHAVEHEPVYATTLVLGPGLDVDVPA